jgi:hypothetical protein
MEEGRIETALEIHPISSWQMQVNGRARLGNLLGEQTIDVRLDCICRKGMECHVLPHVLCTERDRKLLYSNVDWRPCTESVINSMRTA